MGKKLITERKGRQITERPAQEHQNVGVECVSAKYFDCPES